MSIEQVRKVLDRRYGTHGLTDTINQQTAAEIHALYASVGAKGQPSDADRVARRFLSAVSATLTELVPDWCDGDLEVDAKNAIRALAEAKATAERELQLAKNKLCAIGNTLASKPSDYEGRAVDGVTLKGASGNVLFNSDAQVAP